jgi:protein-tyrosine phosphatase
MTSPASKRDLDISKITDYLYISGWPSSHHAPDLNALEIRLILSMHWMRPHDSLGHPPQRILWLPTFDTPLIPIPLTALRRGVEAALPVIQEGGSVLTHCRYGIHRSVAMACSVLIGMGYTVEAAMEEVKTHRAVADPEAMHIQRRIRKFAGYWAAKSQGI